MRTTMSCHPTIYNKWTFEPQQIQCASSHPCDESFVASGLEAVTRQKQCQLRVGRHDCYCGCFILFNPFTCNYEISRSIKCAPKLLDIS
ncbi:hypothetical protein TNCV_4814421 [Trichonephila clavipes]|nr:hypothetical protein TNCV_4814421 [Trichonephila clavipes]